MPTSTNYDAVTAVQDKIIDAIKQGQEATLTAVREVADAFTSALPKVPEWTEAFTSSLPKMPEWAEAYTPKLPDFGTLPSFEAVIGFTEKLWEGQRDFNQKLYDAIAPIGRSAFGAAKDTAKAAAKPAEGATKDGATKPAPEHTPRSSSPKA